MSIDEKLDLRGILDGLGQGVLIFDGDGKLLLDNLAAQSILATDINLLRAEGWKAAAMLFNAGANAAINTADLIRENALKSERPIRFNIYRSGEYMPCWASAIQDKNGVMYTVITLETPDWKIVVDLIDRFRQELAKAVEDTTGHINLINKTLRSHKPDDSAATLAKRITNFTNLIEVHMSRTNRLMDMFERLQDIRVGALRDKIREERKPIKLGLYLEDLLEELDEIQLLDPETEAQDARSRISADIPDDLSIIANKRYLTRILHDILRNAMMYSLRGTPIKIKAHQKGQNVQIEVTDEGYGVRSKESETVFAPFQRAKQPQIISEFGYGLSLHLCKHEVEAMNGRIWFTSEEGIGTTFCILLPSETSASAHPTA